MKTLFRNRHGELRSGWKVLLFTLLTIGFVLVLFFPVYTVGMHSLLLEAVIELASVAGATYIMTRFVNRKPFTAVGISLHPAMFREFTIGCLVGWLLMSGIMAVQVMLGFVAITRPILPWTTIAGIVFQGGALFLVSAFFEELMFRGYMLQSLMSALTFLPAMLITSVIFLIAHASNPNVSIFGLVNIGFASVMFSFAYLKTRSLWLPLGLHFAWNFSQTTLYGFPTSGNEFDAFRVFVVSTRGPEWITGGSFGPEGGFLALLALVIGTMTLLKWRSLAVPEGIITLDSIEDLLPRRDDHEEEKS